MNETKRRAIVWDTIERIAFRPRLNNDRSTWLGVYAKTLHKFWGMESNLMHLGSDDKFDIPFLGLVCEYKIETVEKYSVSLDDLSVNHCCWQNHIDSAFISKASLHSASDRYPRQQMGL